VVRRHPGRKDFDQIELSEKEWRKVLRAAKASGLTVLVEPFDVPSLRLAQDEAADGYKVRAVPLLSQTRRAGLEALEVVDRAIELGFFAAAPKDGACVWCDFRAVCGPSEVQRVSRKPQDRLRDLHELRSRP